MADDLVLFWHRRDLRVRDNLGLAAARDRTSKVIGVFCLDPDILEGEDIAPARVAYMVGSLAELQESYKSAGTELLILKGNPAKVISKLAAALEAKVVYWNRDVEPYSRQRDTEVASALKEKGIELQTKFWDQLLHDPDTIKTGGGKPYKVYGPFWRNWLDHQKPAPVEALKDVTGLSPHEKAIANKAGAIDLPTAKDLGYTWDNGFLLAPGEAAALAQLENFCDA
ncbi:MAG: deoxyribodipyrimidine photo-lyase, partial [Cyanobacteria bacterium J06555_13]